MLLAVGLGAAMVPLRSHLSIATSGLVLIVPVVAGVIVGGSVAGAVGVVAGFLIYDYLFIPPFDTLSVGAGQNWVVLAVYVVVMLLVARLFAHLEAARLGAQRRETEARRLFELSELLVEDRSVDELLQTIVTTVQTVFDVEGVALLLPADGHLAVAAWAGSPLTNDEMRHLDPESGLPVPVGTLSGSADQIRAVALTTEGRAVGLLALRGLPASESDRSLLRTFANHAALALERSRLQAQAVRSELLEEVDRLRRALLGAVSHDLRTPLATMKVASSTLLDPDVVLSAEDAQELYGLLDIQTDRLARLVTSLLDMTRYQAGVLKVDRAPWAVRDLVGDTLAVLRPSLRDRCVQVELAESLPTVDVDPLLIGQVVANLIENADRHAPPGTAVTVSAEMSDHGVVVSVTDLGPGVAAGDRELIFESFVGFDSGGRSGLGLAIARTFVEAHGERIWMEDVPDGGARFAFTLRPALDDTDG